MPKICANTFMMVAVDEQECDGAQRRAEESNEATLGKK
jgi:hypothetical protein